MSLDTQKHSYDGENEKHQKTGDQEHLRHQHGLRALTRLPFEVGQLAAAQADRAGGERLTDLGPVLGDQAERGGQVAQFVKTDLLAEGTERLPPISLAAISASGTPRPPARFIPTRSRKAPTACRKSFRRCAAFCLTST